MKFLKQVGRLFPIILTALVLAIVVWVSSVTSQDPNEVITYGTPIQVTILGQNPDLVITEQSAKSVTVTVRAPRSVHLQLSRNFNLVTARINLSGLTAGTYKLTPEVNIDLRPMQVTEITPDEITLTLEQVAVEVFDIILLRTGNLPVGYEAGEPVLSATQVQVLGPQSKLDEVLDVVASFDLSNTTNTITRTVDLRAIDKRGNVVEGISLSPKSITVDIPITQIAGYRNVFVKIVTTGTIAQGYHLTGLVVTPPNLTIYTSNPDLVGSLPSFLDTSPVNLNGAKESFSVNVTLQVQDGIIIIGNQEVRIEVGIEAIQSSIQFMDIPVEVINLGKGLRSTISPARVDVYLSGPLFLLENLTADSVLVVLDLENRAPGTYQIPITVKLLHPELRLDSVLPGTIEVTISQ